MRTTLATLLGLALVSGAVFAAGYPSFDELDSDGNGKLTKEEIADSGIEMASADSDGDGVLSEAEYSALVKTMKDSES